MAGGINCTLIQRRAGACDKANDAKCRQCGWEEHEKERRLEAIRNWEMSKDGKTGRYYLSVRKEPDDV